MNKYGRRLEIGKPQSITSFTKVEEAKPENRNHYSFEQSMELNVK